MGFLELGLSLSEILVKERSFLSTTGITIQQTGSNRNGNRHQFTVNYPDENGPNNE